jgi:hypothetical protein
MRRTHPNGGIISIRQDIANRAHQISKREFGVNNPNVVPWEWIEEDLKAGKSQV